MPVTFNLIPSYSSTLVFPTNESLNLNALTEILGIAGSDAGARNRYIFQSAAIQILTENVKKLRWCDTETHCEHGEDPTASLTLTNSNGHLILQSICMPPLVTNITESFEEWRSIQCGKNCQSNLWNSLKKLSNIHNECSLIETRVLKYNINKKVIAYHK